MPKLISVPAFAMAVLAVASIYSRPAEAQQFGNPGLMPGMGPGQMAQGPMGMGAMGPAPMGMGPMGAPMAPMAGPPQGGCAMCGGQGCAACDDGSHADCGYGGGFEDDGGVMIDQVGSFIDCPIPITQVKVRYDRAINFEDFDRAAYFFPTTVANGGQLPAREGVMDFEEITTIIEVAFSRRVSGFVELPGRLVESDLAPQANGGRNRDGFGDMRAGGKFAFIANDCEYLTGQVRLYMPTGDATEALGTGHTSIEAGLLYQWNFAERWNVTAEVLDWQAINSPTIPGTTNLFTGNVIQYGTGLSYDVLDHCGDCGTMRVSAVAEFIGWTVIDGFKSGPQVPVSADGDTIINGFYGFRGTWGAHTFYGGYGHCLSNDQWYEEIYRLEYAWRF